MEDKLAMDSRTLITCLIYFTLLLDNILLTVIGNYTVGGISNVWELL